MWGGGRGGGYIVEGELKQMYTFAYTLPNITNLITSKMSSKSAKIHNKLRV